MLLSLGGICYSTFLFWQTGRKLAVLPTRTRDRSTPEKKKACPLQLPYQPGMNMKCLIIKNTDGKPLPKADDKNEGPYEVTQVYTNANGLY